LHALAAVAAEEADSDAVTGLPGRHTDSDRVDDADDLVTRDDRRARIGTDALHTEDVAVAYPATEYARADVAGFGFDELALDQLELMLSGGLDGAICRHGEPLGLVDLT
jgi:hypothetical protein